MVKLVWDGHYLDGKSAEKKPATIELTTDSLKIRVSGSALLWPYHEIRQAQGFYGHEPVRLERVKGTPELIVIDDPDFLNSLHELFPAGVTHLHKPGFNPLRKRLVIGAAAGIACAMFCIYFWGIPLMAALITPHIPIEWEKKLGRSALSALAPEELRCKDRELVETLDRITGVLTAGERKQYAYSVYVVKSPMVNAVALPGGSIIVFSGLIERTGSPDELAGVIAHEIQHIKKRHALKRIVEDSSTGLMISAVTGDATGAMMYGMKIAHMMAGLRYSRQDEDEADREGMRMIISAGIDPEGMVRLFEAMKQKSSMPGVLRYVSTHPDMNARIARLKRLAAAADRPVRKNRTLPGSSDWNRLKESCKSEEMAPSELSLP